MSPSFLETMYELTARNRGSLNSFVVMPDGQVGESLSTLDLPNLGHRGMGNGVFAVIPGSFNPLHDAHKAIYDAAVYGLGRTTVRVFELSIHRIDKEPLSLEELKTRLKQFEGYAPVWVTNASLFLEKAGLVSRWIKPCFQIGIDTAIRLVQHHGVYGVQGINANFVVHRRKVNGEIKTLEDIRKEYHMIPENMESPFELPESVSEISSTAIRQSMSK